MSQKESACVLGYQLGLQTPDGRVVTRFNSSIRFIHDSSFKSGHIFFVIWRGIYLQTIKTYVNNCKDSKSVVRNGGQTIKYGGEMSSSSLLTISSAQGDACAAAPPICQRACWV